MNNNVIIACDFSTQKELNFFLKKFGNKKVFLKIGYQLFFNIGKTGIKNLKNKGYKIFLDLKLHDIPNTVKCGINTLMDLNVDMLTIHAAGGIEMMKLAKKNAKKTKILAVTQLTSTDQKMLKNELLINQKINQVILKYAQNAYVSGVDGVICSPNESKIIKDSINNKFLTITPGIRYSNNESNDQKRIATPTQARKNLADYIVVGRPITQADNPRNMYDKILKEFNGGKNE